MSRRYAIGIDIGGTNLRVALVSEDGVIAKKVKQPSSEKVLDSIIDSIRQIHRPDISGIGLGTAGLVNI